MRYNFRRLSVRSPPNSLTKYPPLPRNTLTPASRHNVARYIPAADGDPYSYVSGPHSVTASLIIRKLASRLFDEERCVPI